MVPPDPIGPGFMSPCMLQEPAKTFRFFSSSGFGISIWALAESESPRIMAANTTADITLMDHLIRRRIFTKDSPIVGAGTVRVNWRAVDLRPARAYRPSTLSKLLPSSSSHDDLTCRAAIHC